MHESSSTFFTPFPLSTLPPLFIRQSRAETEAGALREEVTALSAAITEAQVSFLLLFMSSFNSERYLPSLSHTPPSMTRSELSSNVYCVCACPLRCVCCVAYLQAAARIAAAEAAAAAGDTDAAAAALADEGGGVSTLGE